MLLYCTFNARYLFPLLLPMLRRYSKSHQLSTVPKVRDSVSTESAHFPLPKTRRTSSALLESGRALKARVRDVYTAIQASKQCAICIRESTVIKGPNRISIMGLPSGSHLSQGRVQVQCIGTVYVCIYPVLWEEVPEPAIREMTDTCRPYLEVTLLPCRTMIWNSTILQETYIQKLDATISGN